MGIRLWPRAFPLYPIGGKAARPHYGLALLCSPYLDLFTFSSLATPLINRLFYCGFTEVWGRSPQKLLRFLLTHGLNLTGNLLNDSINRSGVASGRSVGSEHPSLLVGSIPVINV